MASQLKRIKENLVLGIWNTLVEISKYKTVDQVGCVSPLVCQLRNSMAQPSASFPGRRDACQ